jgi:hypothetical protein
VNNPEGVRKERKIARTLRAVEGDKSAGSISGRANNAARHCERSLDERQAFALRTNPKIVTLAGLSIYIRSNVNL